MAYWEQEDLEDRLSVEVVAQIFDDDADGSVDITPLARLQSDSDSYVEGFLRGIYDLEAVRAAPPNEVKRLSLDVAEWMAMKRWPEYIRGEWREKRELTRQELMDLRKGVTRLDVVGSPEPAANQGGTVQSGNPDDTEPRAKMFLDGTGLF